VAPRAGGGFARQGVESFTTFLSIGQEMQASGCGRDPYSSRLIRSPALALLVEASPPGCFPSLVFVPGKKR
jgi:hypothetical protein